MEEPSRCTKVNAYDQQGFWGKLTLFWIFPIFNLGYKKDLDYSDLYACSKQDDPEMWADALEK